MASVGSTADPRPRTDTTLIVVWFYQLNGSFVRFETRDVITRPGMFELVILNADGTESVEQFADSDGLYQRQRELEEQLTAVGWQGPFGRFL